jgi:hypothetical protein
VFSCSQIRIDVLPKSRRVDKIPKKNWLMFNISHNFSQIGQVMKFARRLWKPKNIAATVVERYSR